MTEFHAFLVANIAAQRLLREKIQAFGQNHEYGLPPLSKLQTDLLALSVELNIRYTQEKRLNFEVPMSSALAVVS